MCEVLQLHCMLTLAKNSLNSPDLRHHINILRTCSVLVMYRISASASASADYPHFRNIRIRIRIGNACNIRIRTRILIDTASNIRIRIRIRGLRMRICGYYFFLSDSDNISYEQRNRLSEATGAAVGTVG